MNPKLKTELVNTLQKLGAPRFICISLDSMGDTLNENQVIEILQGFNEGFEPIEFSRTTLN